MCGSIHWIFCFLFFFKQKTAYEMRISDWSSDVCSSDLFNEIPIAHQISWDTRHGGVRLVHLSDEFVIGRGFVHETPTLAIDGDHTGLGAIPQIGRASCRERVCQYV